MLDCVDKLSVTPHSLWRLAGKHKGCTEDSIFAGNKIYQINLFTNYLHYWLGERHEDVDEGVSDQWQEKEEIHGETFEAPATDDMLREFENEMPEAYETPDSVQKGICMTKYI